MLALSPPWARFGAWSVVVCVAGALAAVAGAAAVTHFPPGGAFTSATVNAFVGTGIAGAFLLAHARPHRPEAPWLALLCFSSGFVAASSYLLSSTFFGAGGVVGDAGWQTAIASKAAHGMADGDFQHEGLPPFYPSAYWNVVGTLAWGFGVSAESAVKLSSIALTFLSPLLVFGLWRKLIGNVAAAWLALTLSLAETTQILHKPHEVLSLVAFVPWWLAFVEPSPEPRAKRVTLVAGAVGAAIFCTYYYWFFIGGLVVVLRFAASAIARTHRTFLREWQPGAVTLVVAAVLSSYYWAPLLWSFVQYGCEPLQNRWFTESMTRWPLQDLGWAALIPGAGLVHLYLARRSRLQLSLLWLGGGALLWFLLGLIGILLDTPTLHVKATRLFEAVGFAGCALLLVDVRSFLARSKKARARLASRRTFSLAILVSGIGFAGVPANFSASDLYEQADELRDSIADQVLDLGVDVQGATFLSADEGLYRALPTYNFISENAYIAHPASRFSDRLLFLRTLAGVHTTAAFCWLLRNNVFEPIDYLFLPRGKLLVRDDNFPREPPHLRVRVSFRRSLLKAPCLRELDLLDFEGNVTPLLQVLDTQKRPKGGRDRDVIRAFGG